MNKSTAGIAISGLLLLCLTACNTATRTRLQINTADSASSVSTEDRDAIREVLASLASELRLKDFTSSSIVPETVAFYQQADTTNPLKLIAWVEDGRVLVDLMQFPGAPGETRIYQRARELLMDKLRSRFGERSALVDFRELERPSQPEVR